MSRLVAEVDLTDLARGAAVLGTGGGGNPYVGMLLARQAIREHGPVLLLDVDEVPEGALVVDVGMMGAPTVVVEKLPSGQEIVGAFEALQNHLGRTVTHVVCGEAGGLNSTIPFVVAALLRLPLIDADGIGRAFPELQMMIPTLAGISATPMAIADEHGNSVVITTSDNVWTERIARALTVQMGCNAGTSSFPMTGTEVRTSMVAGTLSLCQELGRLIREARGAHHDPVEAVRQRLEGHRIFVGRVHEVQRRTQGGFARGSCTLAGLEDYAGAVLEVSFQNERLVARVDGRVVASTPDLVMILDQDTAEPITTEELRYGLKAAVLSAPCDLRWKTPEGLAVVGPRAFGYDFDYRPPEGAPAVVSGTGFRCRGTLMTRLIGAEDLPDLARGAAVLGTGGGGDPYIGMLLARQAIMEHGPVELVSVEEVPDDALVADAGMMGAPTVGIEKLSSGREVVAAFRKLEEVLGKTLTHVYCSEAGGSNSMHPFVVAARLGIPLIDADGIGRAFPELQMSIPTLYGITATPMAMADERGNTLVLEAIDNRWTERLGRVVAIEMGCRAAVASYSMSGAQAREATVPGTLSLCQELGRTIRQARAVHSDPVAEVARVLRGARLFEGRVADVARRTEVGFAKGHAEIEGLRDYGSSVLRLEFQNENLIASRDGRLVACVPDLIISLDSETAEPITTEGIRYGLRVTVLVAPCDPRWRSAAGLKVVGPRAFGYDFDYSPPTVLDAPA